jgi:hypothetical protein
LCYDRFDSGNSPGISVSETRKTKIQQEIAALMNQFGITTQALAEKAGLV